MAERIRDPFAAKIMEQRLAARRNDAIFDSGETWVRWLVGGLGLAVIGFLFWFFWGAIPEIAQGRGKVVFVRDGNRIMVSGRLPYTAEYRKYRGCKAYFSSPVLKSKGGEISGRVISATPVGVAAEDGGGVGFALDVEMAAEGKPCDSGVLAGLGGTLRVVVSRSSLFRLLFPAASSGEKQ